MKKAISAILWIFSTAVFAADSNVVHLPVTTFGIKVNGAMEKLEMTLLNPEDMLRRYQPGGADIKHKSVDKGQFQFYATKKISIFSKTIFIYSSFDVSRSSKCGATATKGFLAKMDFSGSDRMLTDNIESYEALICVKENSSNDLRVDVKASLRKGREFNPVIGPIVSDMIAVQTPPLVAAIKEVTIRKR